MHPSIISLMHDQVRAIFRAVTGSDMADAATPPASAPDVPPEEVSRRFAELEALARTIPAVFERVPPFSFAPPIDAFEDGRDLVIDVAVSGIEPADVNVERIGDLLVITGVRKGERAGNGRTYLHAEIPRGPFHRVVQLPHARPGEPRTEIRAGLIRIVMARPKAASA